MAAPTSICSARASSQHHEHAGAPNLSQSHFWTPIGRHVWMPIDIPDLLALYNALLGRAANRAMVAEWDQLGSILDTSRAQLWQIIISLLGISLAGLALFAHILIAKG